MHPEIEAALINTESHNAGLNAVALQNAEKLLSYIEDINLDRPDKFMPTPAQSLYILWSVANWEFHMECKKNGRILYTFCKDGNEKARGSNTVDDFIPQLERYLLLGIA